MNSPSTTLGAAPLLAEERIRQFDGLRTVAFAAVFLSHAFSAPLMWMGVDLFFVLSGLLITGILVRLREQTQQNWLPYCGVFYWRRFIRILPPYALVLTAALLWIYPSARSDWIWYATFTSNVRDTIAQECEGPMGPFWSLAVEEQFYLVWPWIVLFVPLRRLSIVFMCFIVVAPLFRLYLTFTMDTYEGVYRLMPSRMDLLAAGGLLAMLKLNDRLPDGKYWLVLSGLSAAIFGCLTISFPAFRTSTNSVIFNVFGYSLAVGFFTGLIAWADGLRSGVIYRFLTSSIMVYLGRISYTMYLVHQFALYVCREHDYVPSVLAPLVALVITMAVAITSWHLVEAPIQRILRPWITVGRLATPARIETASPTRVGERRG